MIDGAGANSVPEIPRPLPKLCSAKSAAPHRVFLERRSFCASEYWVAGVGYLKGGSGPSAGYRADVRVIWESSTIRPNFVPLKTRPGSIGAFFATT